MALGGLMGLHGVPNGNRGIPGGLYQFVSHTEGTALLFKSK